MSWTERDVSATRPGSRAPALSLRRIADQTWARAVAAEEPEVREARVTHRVLSVAGRVVSVESATYCDCGGAHPISWTNFEAYDLSRSTRDSAFRIAITELFPEADVLAALRADPIVRRMTGGGPPPRTLRELLRVMDEHPVEVEECTYAPGPEFLRQWALHHVEGGRVAVRFSMGHHVELCRGKMIQVGVLLPIPPRLRADLLAADAGRAGFLMKDARRIARGRATVFEYEAKRPER